MSAAVAIRALPSRFSLRARLTTLAVLGAVVVLPLGVLVLYAGVSDGLDDAVTAELRVRADDVAAELAAGFPPVLAGGMPTQVLDEAGTVLAPAGAPALVRLGRLPAPGRSIVDDRPVPGLGAGGRILVRGVRTGAGSRYVVVAGSTAPVREAEQRLKVVLGALGPALVIGVGGAAWLLTGAALRPVRSMTRRAATLSFEEPSERLPVAPGRDELAELSQTLNLMLARIEATVAHERGFVDDASHELRTPIAVLRGELEFAQLELADGADPQACTAALDSALEEVDRLARLADQLLVLARADAGRTRHRRQRVGLMALTAGVVDRLRTGDVRLVVGGVEAQVCGDPDLLEQLLVNLLTNAVHHARALVGVEIAVDGDHVVVQVSDDGPGFDQSVVDRAFERFSRAGTSRTRGGAGAGLGLAIAAAAVEAHDGTIELRGGEPLGGACVVVRLPRVSASR